LFLVQTAGNYRFLVEVEALPHGGGFFFAAGNTEVRRTTAAPGPIAGTVTSATVLAGGTAINLNGAAFAPTITDSHGNYHFRTARKRGLSLLLHRAGELSLRAGESLSSRDWQSHRRGSGGGRPCGETGNAMIAMVIS